MLLCGANEGIRESGLAGSIRTDNHDDTTPLTAYEGAIDPFHG